MMILPYSSYLLCIKVLKYKCPCQQNRKAICPLKLKSVITEAQLRVIEAKLYTINCKLAAKATFHQNPAFVH